MGLVTQCNRHGMLPNLSSLSLNRPGPACRPCAPSISGNLNAATWPCDGAGECPICAGTLNKDSNLVPFVGSGAFVAITCSEQHVAHKGCVARHMGYGLTVCPQGCGRPIIVDSVTAGWDTTHTYLNSAKAGRLKVVTEGEDVQDDCTAGEDDPIRTVLGGRGGDKIFLQGRRNEMRLIRYEAQNGVITFYEGSKGKEHKVRRKLVSGTEHYFEGQRDQERLVRANYYDIDNKLESTDHYGYGEDGLGEKGVMRLVEKAFFDKNGRKERAEKYAMIGGVNKLIETVYYDVDTDGRKLFVDYQNGERSTYTGPKGEERLVQKDLWPSGSKIVYGPEDGVMEMTTYASPSDKAIRSKRHYYGALDFEVLQMAEYYTGDKDSERLTRREYFTEGDEDEEEEILDMTNYYEGEMGKEYLVRIKFHMGGRNSEWFYSGLKGEERKVRALDDSTGVQKFYDDGKDKERLVRVEFPNGRQQFFEGANGEEQMVKEITKYPNGVKRVEMRGDDCCDVYDEQTDGKKLYLTSEEDVYKVVHPDGRVDYYDVEAVHKADEDDALRLSFVDRTEYYDVETGELKYTEHYNVETDELEYTEFPDGRRIEPAPRGEKSERRNMEDEASQQSKKMRTRALVAMRKHLVAARTRVGESPRKTLE